MEKTTYIPTEYRYFKQTDQPAFFSGEASSVKTVVCLATPENGWTLTRYDTGRQPDEDAADIRDSLEAIKEPRGISLEDLTRELDV